MHAYFTFKDLHYFIEMDLYILNLQTSRLLFLVHINPLAMHVYKYISVKAMLEKTKSLMLSLLHKGSLHMYKALSNVQKKVYIYIFLPLYSLDCENITDRIYVCP